MSDYEYRYVLYCDRMQDAYRVLYNVAEMTMHWVIRPYISRQFLVIRYGNAVIELVVGRNNLTGRRYHKQITETDLYNFLDKYNESLRLGHVGLFEH